MPPPLQTYEDELRDRTASTCRWPTSHNHKISGASTAFPMILTTPTRRGSAMLSWAGFRARGAGMSGGGITTEEST